MAATTLESYNRAVIKRANKGDLLEFNRGVYSHWAVYIGNDEVVHLAGVDNDGLNASVNPSHSFSVCGKKFSKAMVKKESVWNVMLGSKVKINNDKDHKLKPRSAQEIVKEALSKIGEIGYNVLWKNCEHFAAYCRYGVSWSKQADNAMLALGAVVVAGVAAELC
ncbi:phospholipase A and acyltransferase 2-like [Crassostrea angulata]|uniref:phospholipase A and acyltransferase 2-like n=1 Tax=Magallana angulata TaxID=2784310 RepID=UPI0022B1818D|nr:phospholipase A and acyltransferase 2-like [Crassostrea angulata]